MRTSRQSRSAAPFRRHLLGLAAVLVGLTAAIDSPWFGDLFGRPATVQAQSPPFPPTPPPGGNNNQPPQITDFSVGQLYGDIWEVSGQVADDGGNSGLTVYINGVYIGQVETAIDGSFYRTIEITPSFTDWLGFKAEDSGGLESNSVHHYF